VNVSDVVIKFESVLVIGDGLLSFFKVVERVTHTDVGLDILGVILERLLMVFSSVLRVASLEEEVTHGHESKDVFGVDSETFLEVFCGFVKLHLL